MYRRLFQSRPFRTLCVAVALGLASSTSLQAQTSEAAPAEPLTLRILSYNIHHGAGLDKKVDIERIASVINATNPDLVAVQEVDNGVTRSGEVHQPAELGRLTKMQVISGDNIFFQGGRYGNAFLSRFPIRKYENHKIPSFYPGEQRGVMQLEIELPGGHGELTFFATHFDYRQPDDERLGSVKLIADVLATLGDRPAILAGDINAMLGSPTLDALQEQWTLPPGDPISTFPADKATRQIDFIFHRPTARWEVVEYTVIDERVASDHRPILLVLKLLPEAK